ncbi:hypothetical protein BDV96DRAFT_642458 [Lophiotrema nucula]|uniref:Rhodopsin domain-containing protein n=1 Tax=Lophiotrema nucula TaxID=690887 RepID=A0A6A5ZKQ9_9PLEO|nr:hypothetical protein BDV96DRAFT_642458 [Lophiotrema nucula]
MYNPDLTAPVAAAPSGVVPNFTNPPNQALLAYSTLIVSLACVTLFTWIRFLVKLCIVGTLHVEDYIIPFAWLAAVGHVVPSFIIDDFAPIIHTWDMQLDVFSRFLLYFRLSSIFYNISMLLIKVAMLLQVLRIFVPRGSQSKTYYIVYLLIWLTCLYYIATVFAMVFTCIPVEKAWKPWIPGKCMSMGIIAMTTASVNLASDLAILALCQRVIWNVIKVDRKQRLKLSIVFCAGIVPCVFSALCLYYNSLMMHSNDFTYSAALMSLACYGEIASGMFVLFLPVLPRFFSWAKQKWHSSRTRRPSTSLDFSDIGVDENLEERSTKSMWHISWMETRELVVAEEAHSRSGQEVA